MIEIELLSVQLAGRTALNQVSASFAPGRVTAILGPNGAGKTTLLRALLGLVEYTGNIRLKGEPLAALSRAQLARQFGYLAQANSPSWNLRVADIVMLGRAPHRHPPAAPAPADHDAVAAALAATDTMDFAYRLINDLSGGERARVLFARVLATQPDWLLIDEPLNHLDPLHQRNMLQLLRAQAVRGAGVIVVLHDLNAALRVADDVLVLREGALVAHGPTATALTPEVLMRAYDMVFAVDHIGQIIRALD